LDDLVENEIASANDENKNIRKLLSLDENQPLADDDEEALENDEYINRLAKLSKRNVKKHQNLRNDKRSQDKNIKKKSFQMKSNYTCFIELIIFIN
jgi:hypothetical protein